MAGFNFFTNKKKDESEDLALEDVRLVDDKFSLKSFFRLLVAKSGKIATLNLCIVLLISPIFLSLLSYVGSFFSIRIADLSSAPQSSFFPQTIGVARYEGSAATSALTALFGVTTRINVDNTLTKILNYAGYISIFNFVLANIGAAYVLRNIVREQPIFLWSDFWHAIKKNWKQGIFTGIFDVVVIYLISVALPFYSANANSTPITIMFFVMILFSVMYYIMRIYLYLILVTFDLSFYKSLKNAFILTMVGLKRDVMLLLGTFVVLYLSIYLLNTLTGVGLVLPFIFTVAFLMYIGVYCTYPILKRYMIDPYYNDAGELKTDSTDDSEDADLTDN